MADDDLARRIHAVAHLTGDFLLRSGATSTVYFDKYLFEADPALLRAIAEAMVELLPGDSDVLAGLELGGVPIVTLLSQLTGCPSRFVRKRAKEYGTRRVAEGGDVEGMRVTLVEDVVTSGGAVLEACEELRRQGAVVEHVVCVIDREAGGSDNLAAAGLALHALFTMSALEQAAA